jgi:hypothetical protein
MRKKKESKGTKKVKSELKGLSKFTKGTKMCVSGVCQRSNITSGRKI